MDKKNDSLRKRQKLIKYTEAKVVNWGGGVKKKIQKIKGIKKK